KQNHGKNINQRNSNRPGFDDHRKIVTIDETNLVVTVVASSVAVDFDRTAVAG
ncbi:hypothetical protein A2U01_0042636, partial [Trifolium medium]|nr:hypothetical protein [Trifolium medium]